MTVFAVSDQEHWLQAQAAYQQQNFSGAATALRALGTKSAPAWYNLAQCAYQLKDYLTALALWRRAQSLELQALGYTGPIYQLAAQQILHTQAVLATSNYCFDATRAQVFGLGALTAPGVPAAADQPAHDAGQPAAGTTVNATAPTTSHQPQPDRYQRLVSTVLAQWQTVWQVTPVLLWQLLLLLSWLGFSYLIYRRVSTAGALLGGRDWVVSLLLLVSSGWFGYTLLAKQRFNQTQWGVITAAPAQLYLGPGADYPRLEHRLPVATFVKILAETAQSWYAVQAAEQVGQGWVRADDLVRC